MCYRIVCRMKVTALIPEELVTEVRKHNEGKTLTQALIRALREWTAQQRLRQLNDQVSAEPLSLTSASDLRDQNRHR